MSEVQRAHDVGAILRLLSDLLRVEMYQLRRDHRPDDLKQSPQKSGCARESTYPVSGDSVAEDPVGSTPAVFHESSVLCSTLVTDAPQVGLNYSQPRSDRQNSCNPELP